MLQQSIRFLSFSRYSASWSEIALAFQSKQRKQQHHSRNASVAQQNSMRHTVVNIVIVMAMQQMKSSWIDALTTTANASPRAQLDKAAAEVSRSPTPNHSSCAIAALRSPAWPHAEKPVSVTPAKLIIRYEYPALLRNCRLLMMWNLLLGQPYIP